MSVRLALRRAGGVEAEERRLLRGRITVAEALVNVDGQGLTGLPRRPTNAAWSACRCSYGRSCKHT